MRTHSILLSVTIVLAMLTVSFSVAQIVFTKHTIEQDFDYAFGIYACDVDRDGDMDVLGAALDDSEISWWRNDGGTPILWTKQIIDGNFDGATSAFATDVDGDLDVDVLGSSWYGQEIAWWRNDGGDPITWSKTTIRSGYDFAHEVYSYDLDEDGDADVLGASTNLSRISWWRNDGGDPITWVEQTIGVGFTGAKSARAADIDGDGDLDVIGAAIQADEVTWWRNDGGDPIQWTEFVIDNHFDGAHRVEICDLDEDGDCDVVGTAIFGHEIAWYENSGGDPVVWAKQTITEGFLNACIGLPTDVDLDGDVDIVGTAQLGDEVAWWRNDGGDPIVWTKCMIDDDFDGAWPGYACDLDGDSDIDVVAGASFGDEVAWWENGLYGALFQTEVTSGHAPLTIGFTNLSNADPPLTSWLWDFNSDGTVNSQEENPTWTYTEPGIYSVSLEVSNGSVTYRRFRENYIHVFDGESALAFDGQDSYASCPAVPDLNVTAAFTIEAWINPADWGEFPSLGLGRIIDKRSISLFLVDSYLSFHRHSLLLQLVHENGSVSYSNTPDESIALDAWQHIAVTFNGQSVVKAYINGIEQTVTHVHEPSGVIGDNRNDDLIIGNTPDLGSAFRGIIDEIRLWDVARSHEDVQTCMNTYLGGDEFGLMGYWQMNEGCGEAITDFTGNGHDGIVVDAAWVQGFHLTPVSIDRDGDGVIDGEDNCPNEYNPGQEDEESDGVGDECDNCPGDPNFDQADGDRDGTGDVCDACTDTDGDGYGDPGYPTSSCDEDNCPAVYNPDQADVERGNIDCAGGVDVLDVLSVVNHILGTHPLSGGPLDRADCNGDGGVNILDALGIINVILGVGECAPAWTELVVTSEMIQFCESLKSYLATEDFAEFMTLVKTKTQIPKEYNLAQNYPNPFNPKTEIQFGLPEAARVKLTVYNILGQEIAVLVDSRFDVGYHFLTWDASHMTSGIYFYRIEAGTFVATKCMALIK
ncbi:MAG: VCBS repeat-containing protein [Gemmatimonadota bacterium]|nr:MAG: VCBS repeat-containing protein [Gemmatimonadota bacterium]